MKILFASDIHGCLPAAERIWAVADAVQPDAIVVLGDALYHGPRNPLPEGYDPKQVAALLNCRKNRIIAVRGNCDSEVDQMLIEYPMMGDFAWVLVDGKRLFLTHGHKSSPASLPPLADGDVFVYGHTHIPKAEKKVHADSGGLVHIWNPGSCSLPKDGYQASYGLLADGIFCVCAMDGTVLLEDALW
ncbi:phosphodiesterase [Oleidesulfovibrio sp.]|uniref:phosphodiesterase n=1 Tax=Oleidesulfovibrio sp. TaxID=2909707 RepID=UPI003A8524B6